MRKIAFILMVCSVFGGVSATAAEGDPKALFVKGNAAFNAGDYNEASDLFRAAYEAKPSWKLLYNIGQAEAAAKRYGLALDSFENYLAEGGDEIDNARNESVMNEIKRMRLLVGNLEVEAPDGAEIFIDERSRGVAPFPSVVRVGVGNKDIEVRLNQQAIYTKTLKIVGGVTAKVIAEAPAGMDAAVSPVVEPGGKPNKEKKERKKRDRKPGSPLVISGWILTGVGAATLAVGGVMGGLAVSGEKDISEKCTGQLCPTTEVSQTDIDAVTTKANVSTALLIAGGAIAATGVTLLILGMRKKEKAVAVIPAISPGFSGLALEGRF